ncbi:hypothetical protein [Lentzea atacamensis]|uniref:hypothetical protein n=1 Tax=Lentzea atacamensis TaxID=531938 RepID=UPI0014739F70|nr:hypothetical protein [Lentzea atacamensis]
MNLVLAASTGAAFAGTWWNWGPGWALLVLAGVGLVLGVFVLDDGTEEVPKK